MNPIESYTFIIDVDGTLCPIKRSNEEYSDLVPNKGMVIKIKEYHDAGARIILFSSRNMNTYLGNIGKINKHTAPTMIEWLNKWSIPYDEIIFGKPWPGTNGYYVDDRSLRPSEFINLNIDEYEYICSKDRVIDDR